MAGMVQNRHYLAAAPCQSGVVYSLSLMYTCSLRGVILLSPYGHDALKLKAIATASSKAVASAFSLNFQVAVRADRQRVSSEGIGWRPVGALSDPIDRHFKPVAITHYSSYSPKEIARKWRSQAYLSIRIAIARGRRVSGLNPVRRF
jgi:hypothetical protein